MKLNKKETKVLLENKTKAFGAFGLLLEFGIPFVYLANTFELFRFEEAGYSFTGWGIVAVATALFMLRGKIKDVMTAYGKELSATAQRLRKTFVYVTLALIVTITSIFFQGFIYLFVSLALGSGLSYFPFSVYDKENAKRLRLQKLLDDRKDINDLQELQNLKLKKDTL